MAHSWALHNLQEGDEVRAQIPLPSDSSDCEAPSALPTVPSGLPAACFTCRVVTRCHHLWHWWEDALDLPPAPQILMSVAEHHSSLAPFQQVAHKTGACIKEVCLTADTEEVDTVQDFERKLSSKTKVGLWRNWRSPGILRLAWPLAPQGQLP